MNYRRTEEEILIGFLCWGSLSFSLTRVYTKFFFLYRVLQVFKSDLKLMKTDEVNY